jgi:putative ABC transport system substrate-binding protein
MRRRAFITLLGSAALAPLGTRAQQAGKLPTVGFMGTGTEANFSAWTSVFAQRLRELGWIESRTVAIEYRWGEGRPTRFTEIAAEFVRLKVDVIVTMGSAVPAFKRATSNIPIVFAVATDPVGGGLVASLARPGGNVTGMSNQQSDLAGKRLGLFREIVPGARRLAVMGNAGYPEAVLEMQQVEAAARNFGIDVAKFEIRRSENVAPAFDRIDRQADALYVVADGLINANRTRIMTLAIGARLPTICNTREYAAAGGLMSYGPNFPDLFRHTAEYVDKILRGAKPADLPVQQPTKFDFVVNLTTAKALGLTIPQAVLLRADEVIE